MRFGVWSIRAGLLLILIGAALPWIVEWLPVDLFVGTDVSGAGGAGTKDYLRVVPTGNLQAEKIAFGFVALGVVLLVTGIFVQRRIGE
jgi:hypothetical protein